jgi:hypothetical protein
VHGPARAAGTANNHSRRAPGVEEVVRAQFGGTFKPFRDLRIRRNELEYPIYPDDPIEAGEAEEALDSAGGIIAAADRLLPHLGMF